MILQPDVLSCACGKPLHYADPAIEHVVQQAVARYGPTVAVSTLVGTWLVPRHYYALHGLVINELPQLAAVYQWKKTRTRGSADLGVTRAG